MIRRLAPLGLVVFGLAYLWQALSIPLDPWSAAEAVNARTLPTVYAVVLVVLGGALLARPGEVRAEAPATRATSGRRWLTLAAHCAAIVCFGLLIPLFGLWVGIAALLGTCLVIAGERRILVLAIAPLAIAGAAWFLLRVVLDIYVAPGRYLP